MQWIKRNASLALGVGMPILLVVFFALASWLPKYFVAPPQYDVVFISPYYDYGNQGFKLEVKDKRLHLRFIGENMGYGWPKLYRYSPATDKLKEIDIPVPESLNKAKGVVIQSSRVTALEVPELKNVALDDSLTSPDGYQFISGYNRGGAGLMGELFYSSRYSTAAVLNKNGRVVKIPHIGNDYYSSARLVGWVIP